MGKREGRWPFSLVVSAMAAVSAVVWCPIHPLSAAAAVRSYSVEAENRIGTGDVNITLEEFQLDEQGREIPYVDGKQVVPGQKVDKRVRIRNEAEPAWIRARVEYSTEDGLEGMSDEMLDGMDPVWKKCGAYFYYRKPVETGEEISLFQTLTVPADWDESAGGKGFSVTVTAQAVQTIHVFPDFETEDPWFGIPVEECVHSPYVLDEEGERQEFSVIFENGSEGFVKTGEDFFDNFSRLMPGDTVQDEVTVGSRYRGTVDIWFRTETLEQSEDGKRLLEQLRLTVWKGEDLLYDGPLEGKELEPGILLAEGLSANEQEELVYRIHMPEELTNSSAVKQAKVKWIFRAEYGTSSGGGGGSSGGKPSGGNQVPKPGKEVPESVPEVIQEWVEALLPKMGDSSRPELWLSLLAGGFLLLAAAMPGKKR